MPSSLPIHQLRRYGWKTSKSEEKWPSISSGLIWSPDLLESNAQDFHHLLDPEQLLHFLRHQQHVFDSPETAPTVVLLDNSHPTMDSISSILWSSIFYLWHSIFKYIYTCPPDDQWHSNASIVLQYLHLFLWLLYSDFSICLSLFLFDLQGKGASRQMAGWLGRPARSGFVRGGGIGTSQGRALGDLWSCIGWLGSRRCGCCGEGGFWAISDCRFSLVWKRFYYRWGRDIPIATYDEKGFLADFSEDSSWLTKIEDVTISRDQMATVW